MDNQTSEAWVNVQAGRSRSAAWCAFDRARVHEPLRFYVAAVQGGANTASW